MTLILDHFILIGRGLKSFIVRNPLRGQTGPTRVIRISYYSDLVGSKGAVGITRSSFETKILPKNSIENSKSLRLPPIFINFP